MSAYGMTVAVGACVNDDNGSWSSHARIFTYYSIPKKCNRLGNTLAGATSGDQFGKSVSISSRSVTVSAGACSNDDNGYGSGLARVFDKRTYRCHEHSR